MAKPEASLSFMTTLVEMQFSILVVGCRHRYKDRKTAASSQYHRVLLTACHEIKKAARTLQLHAALETLFERLFQLKRSCYQISLVADAA